MAIKGLMSPVYRIYEKERKFLLIAVYGWLVLQLLGFIISIFTKFNITNDMVVGGGSPLGTLLMSEDLYTQYILYIIVYLVFAKSFTDGNRAYGWALWALSLAFLGLKFFGIAIDYMAKVPMTVLILWHAFDTVPALVGAILLPFTVCGRLSRGGTSEPDFYGPIFPSAVLKYSQIRQDLLRFVPCR